MARAVIRVLGLPQLKRNADKVANAQPAMIEAALQVAVLPLEARWKELVPVKTGTYRRSIHTEVLGRSATGASVMVGTNLTDPPYPVYLEFGTRRMPAHPSARPAFDERRGDVEREFRRAYERLLGGLL